MTVEEAQKVGPVAPPPPQPVAPVDAPKDVAGEKAVVPPSTEVKPDDSKALAIVESIKLNPHFLSVCLFLGFLMCMQQASFEVLELCPNFWEPAEGKEHGGSVDRDAVLARVATEKRLSFARAWEESEKSKAENKAQKKFSAIGVWENCKKANLEAELKQIEEQLEKKKAKYTEKVKNKVAIIHKAAEEKRATTEAKRGEDLLKAEETAAKYRATGTGPKKSLGCF